MGRVKFAPARLGSVLAAMPALGVAAALLSGCSTAHYREAADQEVAGIIDAKQREAGLDVAPISIDPPADTLRDRLLRRIEELRSQAGIDGELPDLERAGPWMREPDLPEAPGGDTQLQLTLEDCLRAAAENSRDYRTQKENVYLAALTLTLERYSFRNQYFGTLSGETGQTGPEERSGTIDADAGLSRTLASGASILFDLGATLFKAFTGGADEVASSLLSFSVTQPLLRGAGRSIVEEPLTQAERDALYAVRSFERFKRILAVRVASDLYGVLQQADSLENARANYQSLIRTREQTEALAEAGRQAEFQVDQARQSELKASDSLTRTQESYKSSLDRFKITLGLPTDANIVIDPAELRTLAEAGLVEIRIDPEQAVALALDNRLDLRNSRDELEDAERRVKVTENALKAALDVSFSANAGNEDNKLAALEFGDGTYVFGADLDLPLDRKQERNAYRSSLISLERARRTYAQAEDNVKLDVRQAIRNLMEAKESFRIEKSSIELAERRVDSTSLLQQAGRADTRDILEAQDALLDAQNGLTRALVNHTVARLELLRDLGLLTVDQEGLSYDASTDRLPEARP